MLHIVPGPAAVVLFCTATCMTLVSVWEALAGHPFLLTSFSLSLEREGLGTNLQTSDGVIIILSPL